MMSDLLSGTIGFHSTSIQASSQSDSPSGLGFNILQLIRIRNGNFIDPRVKLWKKKAETPDDAKVQSKIIIIIFITITSWLYPELKYDG